MIKLITYSNGDKETATVTATATSAIAQVEPVLYCKHNHVMSQYCGEIPPAYIGKYETVKCVKCSKRRINRDYYYHHCGQCEYDLCR